MFHHACPVMTGLGRENHTCTTRKQKQNCATYAIFPIHALGVSDYYSWTALTFSTARDRPKSKMWAVISNLPDNFLRLSQEVILSKRSLALRKDGLYTQYVCILEGKQDPPLDSRA